MATDIKLDQNGGTWLIAESLVFKCTASDLMLDAPTRRRGGASPHRRALVHDFDDGLTLNFAGDYPAGVKVVGTLRAAGDVAVAGDVTVAGSLILDGERLTPRLMEGQLQWAEARIAALEKTVEALLTLAGAVVVPAWRTKTEILEGDDMGMVSPSAESLGLTIEYEIDQLRPGFGHEDVISMEPPSGTVVPRGSTVRVRLNLEG